MDHACIKRGKKKKKKREEGDREGGGICQRREAQKEIICSHPGQKGRDVGQRVSIWKSIHIW